MRLLELEPKFVVTTENGCRWVETLAEAQGVIFSCPRCFVNLGNTLVGAHSIICWSSSRGARPDATPLPGRWALTGTGFDDLSLNAESPETRDSVQVLGSCGAHFHVKNGEVTFC